MEKISGEFGPNSPSWRVRTYLAPDLDGIEHNLIRRFDFSHVNLEWVERALSLCSDRGRTIAPDSVAPIAVFAEAHSLPIVAAQAHRALGLTRRDPAELARALAIFEEHGATPYASRARCEGAVLTGDEDDLAAGMRVLDALGDRDYLGRLAQARGR